MKVRLRRKRPEPPPAVTRSEIEEALGAVRAAEDRLNMAEGVFVDVAILELTAARQRLDSLFRLVRTDMAS